MNTTALVPKPEVEIWQKPEKWNCRSWFSNWPPIRHGVHLDSFWHFTLRCCSIMREPLNIGRLVMRLDDWVWSEAGEKVRGDPLATDQSQPTSHFTTSQTRTSHFTPARIAIVDCRLDINWWHHWHSLNIGRLVMRLDDWVWSEAGEN